MKWKIQENAKVARVFKEWERKFLTQKPVLTMKNSIEAPTNADATPIFKYQSRNFVFNCTKLQKWLLSKIWIKSIELDLDH